MILSVVVDSKHVSPLHINALNYFFKMVNIYG
jgi:hypothetical protein